MKLLLYSDFSHMPLDEVQHYLKKEGKKTCLFCSYADEDAHSYIRREKNHLSEIFAEIIDLTPNFHFDMDVDCVFVSGGFNYELSYKLKKYNQFDKVKELAKKVLYIGNSAGSVMVGKDFEYYKNYEPPRIGMNLDENKFGFGLIDRNVLVHASDVIFSEKKNKLHKETSYTTYLKVKDSEPGHVKIENNSVAIVEDDKITIKTYPWEEIIEKFSK